MRPKDIPRAIASSGLTIYDSLTEHPELLIESSQLEALLNRALVGLDLNYPVRTRSKILKSRVCEALGYPAPKSFRKCQPRFPGQNFDTYVQKSNNLQVWNEEVSHARRCVLIRVDQNQRVTKVRVVSGDVIANLDTTGTLTHMYQAASRQKVSRSLLVSKRDTENFRSACQRNASGVAVGATPIDEVFRRLKALTGTTVANPGIDQERNRGRALHDAVCRRLGKVSWCDDGQFPDITDELLEIKLQTAPTIDLGLICPTSTEPLLRMPGFRHCDVRSAIFYGVVLDDRVHLDHLVLTTGADFLRFFRRFEGKVRNTKLQIRLPGGFFD